MNFLDIIRLITPTSVVSIQYKNNLKMVIRIVVAGEAQCEVFAEMCLIVDYLDNQLPNFCYERIPKSVLEWKTWLCKINQKNNWHHIGSPLIWKELLIKGSKPYYIGGASEFLEYVHSYYNLDIFINPPKYEGLIKNFSQFQKKIREDKETVIKPKTKKATTITVDKKPKTDYIVCIYGAAYPLTMHLISGLLEMSVGPKSITKIYIYDEKCSFEFMEYVEHECSYIGTNQSTKVVKFVDKIGVAITQSDMLLVLEHVPFQEEMAVGEWLHANKRVMESLAMMINASASRKMYILLPNLGPACYNATILMNNVTVDKKNIVVATSDLGLDILSSLAEIAEVPMRNIFCPPVWGFVGINHLVDTNTTIHKYNTFDPYTRHTRVKNSTLLIGSLTPEIRTLEYMMYFDDTLWTKVAEKKKKIPEDQIPLNKAVAVLNLVRIWLFDHNPDYIVNLGIPCDGSFGLNFNGAFSQPARFVQKTWVPASDFPLPKDRQMKLSYLEQMAKMVMKMDEEALPKLNPYTPCKCKVKILKKKGAW